VAPACLAIALAAAIAGCGSSGGGPLASDSDATIIALAKADTIAAQSVTMSGRPTSSISVNLAIVPGTGCAGTITQGTTKSRLVLVGNTIYAHTDGMPTKVWMKGTAASQAVLAALCQLESVLAPLSASTVTSAKRSVTLYAGQPALTLSWIDGATGQSSSLTVTDTAAPLLLSITEGSASISFAGYGATKKIDPPSAS
jgi:hypothetical protein